MKKTIILAYTIAISFNLFAQTFKDEKFVVLNYSIEIDNAFVMAVEDKNKTNPKLKDFSIKNALKNTPIYEEYVDYKEKKTKFRCGPDLGNYLTASLIDTLFLITGNSFKEKFNNEFYPLNELENKLKNNSFIYPDLPNYNVKKVVKKAPEYNYYFYMKVQYVNIGGGIGVGDDAVSFMNLRPKVILRVKISHLDKVIYSVRKTANLDKKIATSASIGIVGIESNDNTPESMRVLFAGLFNRAMNKVVEELAKNE